MAKAVEAVEATIAGEGKLDAHKLRADLPERKITKGRTSSHEQSDRKDPPLAAPREEAEDLADAMTRAARTQYPTVSPQPSDARCARGAGEYDELSAAATAARRSGRGCGVERGARKAALRLS